MFLSNELYSRVFSNLCLKDFINIRSVSSNFDDVLRNTRFYDELTIKNTKIIPKNFVNIYLHRDYDYIHFKDLTHVEYLNFGDLGFYDEDLVQLQYFKNLKSIKGFSFGIQEYDIKFIINVNSLYRFELHLSGVEEEDFLSQLIEMKSLRSLVIMNAELLTMNKINLLNQCSNITKITLVYEHEPNIELIKHLNRLKKLKIRYQTDITKIKEFEQLRELNELNFTVDVLRQETIDDVSKFVNLKKLKISYCFTSFYRIDLKNLTRLKHLEELQIFLSDNIKLYVQVDSFKRLNRLRLG